ncbi:lamin tail domain-containing protein [Lujinxingia vulgaris]|uniref:Lamin tail domain-containing protein n=1 Tax=Lujinxingia vulgaris TaxID=2600176 RepID=A0A5C6XE62_9DELT|nr:lamin tail domain-containing protein [Lujinxingia vulgaris]TXD41706.1 lamin tail domain-containing protein [Lujinxingia vulgaris]
MMLRRKTLAMLAALSLAAGAAACGDTDDPSPTPLPDAGEDVGPDAELDTDPNPDVEEDVDVDPDPDADVDPDPIVAPTPGDLVITELMKQPTEVAAFEGQWVELLNTSDAELELEGCALGSSSLDEAVVIGESLTVESGGYLTLAASANAGFDADFILEGLVLAEGEGSVSLDCDGTTITEVVYDAGESYPSVAGASLSRDPAFNGATDDSGDYWCAATAAYNGADLGTPGAVNPSCIEGPDASAAIADLLLNGPGDDGKLIEGATVTYVRPMVGVDDAGFFVQSRPEGPALFVAVAEGEEMPVEVNDVVSFLATSVVSNGGATWVDGFESLTVDASNGDRDALVTDLTAATDLITSLNSYTHRIVSASMTISGDLLTFAGPGHQAYPVATEGVAEGAQLRMATELRQAFGLESGCEIDLSMTPLWRFEETAQFMVYDATEIDVSECPELSVVSATSTSATQVELVLTRALGPILADGSQFTIEGLTVTGAVVDGPKVILTTEEQTSAAEYTVELDDSLTDIFGATIAADASATFTGFVALELVISEVMARFTGGNGDPGEFIELYNPGTEDFDLSGCLLKRDSSSSNEMEIDAGVIVPAGGYTLFASSANAGASLTVAQELGFGLNNGSMIYWIECAGEVLDEIATPGPQLGRSFQKDVNRLVTPNPAGSYSTDVWCFTPGAEGDEYVVHINANDEAELKFGTPGTANLACD